MLQTQDTKQFSQGVLRHYQTRKASRFAGVSKHNRGTLWRAMIRSKTGKQIQLCSAPLTEEGELKCARAYWQAFEQKHGCAPSGFPNPFNL